MQTTRLAIPDVVLIEPKVFGDARGFFFESFNQRAFNAATGTAHQFVQDNHSRSSQGVLRGLPQPDEDPLAREQRQARIVECNAALAQLAQTLSQVAAGDAARLARMQDVVGRISADYRQRLQMLEGPPADNEPEVQAESPDALQERRLTVLTEMEVRLDVLHAERDALYAERKANRINDDSLRLLGGELDLLDIALREQLAVARRHVASTTKS